MGFLDDGLRRYQAILAVIFLVACAAYLLTIHITGIETEVMRDRFPSADALFSGEIPLTEYPPLALVFVAIPRLFADTAFGYNVAFVAEMFLFMVAGLVLSSKLATAMGRDENGAMLLYSVLMLLMLEFVLDRFDVIPAVMTIAALYMFVTGRREWAFVLLALGTLTKLYPALLFPVLFIYLAYNREWRDLVRGTVAFVGTGVVAIAVCLLVNPDLITGFLGYHEDRPLQIESVASSFVYLLSMLGLTDVWIQSASDPGSFLSDNLRGPLPDAVADVLMPLMVVAILAVCALYLYRRYADGEDGDMRLAAFAMLGCLMAFLVVNKVFSTQYLIWLIPSVLFLCLASDEGASRRVTLCMLGMVLLSQINFAYSIGYLGGGPNIDDLGMLIVLARNVLAVYMLWLCVSGVTGRRVPRPSGRGSGDAPSQRWPLTSVFGNS